MTGWHKRLPQTVKGRAQALGKLGLDWIAQLDENIAHLEMQWKITVKEVLEGGSAAFAYKEARGNQSFSKHFGESPSPLISATNAASKEAAFFV